MLSLEGVSSSCSLLLLQNSPTETKIVIFKLFKCLSPFFSICQKIVFLASWLCQVLLSHCIAKSSSVSCSCFTWLHIIDWNSNKPMTQNLSVKFSGKKEIQNTRTTTTVTTTNQPRLHQNKQTKQIRTLVLFQRNTPYKRKKKRTYLFAVYFYDMKFHFFFALCWVIQKHREFSKNPFCRHFVITFSQYHIWYTWKAIVCCQLFIV